MSDYEVTLVNDNMQEFYVRWADLGHKDDPDELTVCLLHAFRFHGPKDSEYCGLGGLLDASIRGPELRSLLPILISLKAPFSGGVWKVRTPSLCQPGTLF
jgi:hypothetical protein